MMNPSRPSPVTPPADAAAALSVVVATPGAPYIVSIGEGVLSRIAELALSRLGRPPSRAFLCFDANVPHAFIAEASRALEAAGLAVAAEPLRGGEAAKRLATVENLAQQMARARLERGDPVVVIGGGVAGDVAGFAASIYRRGVPVIQCPSTLLSMVDASVGGKTGVNLDLGPPQGVRKNFLGAIHQPLAVLADIRLLASLPDRQFRSGLAECVKHGLIGGQAGDPGLFDWTERSASAISSRSAAVMTELVARNVAVKARIVERDPHEEAPIAQGGRALLNLGHTFGHALEPMPSLSPTGDPADAPLEHGEAVALGLVAAAACAERLGVCQSMVPHRIANLLGTLKLPRTVTGLPPSWEVYEAMLDDKKTTRGLLRLVLPLSACTAAVVEAPPRHAVIEAINVLRGVFTPDYNPMS